MFPLHHFQVEELVIHLAGGQYVRNGGNPLANNDPERTAHWFDGDGMLSGVLFRSSTDGSIVPEFVNQYLETDVFRYTKRNKHLTRPVLPSITSLVNPASSFLHIMFEIMRAVLLVVLSQFQSAGATIKKISVANTSVIFHDGRALATCESGPPLRFTLPSLETVGWFDGAKAENEIPTASSEGTFGGHGPLSWMREWTTAHPRVDPLTNELISYHSTFVAPYVRYSVIQPRHTKSLEASRAKPLSPVRPGPPEYAEEEQCRLYYFSFPLGNDNNDAAIKHQWALSAIAFEFPTVAPAAAMRGRGYVYGCTTGRDTYRGALGKAAKIDHLAKMDVATLIARGEADPPREVTGCVDARTVREIMAHDDPRDPIRLFGMPEGWFAQEPRFVPRDGAKSEDDGFLLTYVFDEAQLDKTGACRPDAVSELWLIDAKGMRDVVARVKLPQRVPYGMHGNWFSEEDISGQIPDEKLTLGSEEVITLPRDKVV
ncbi:carotenoid cleavage dioxygenase [Verticillium alfalfae VaMs.102]|uniref:Carotenoid cleavage dioxygenase n=1 Tax=Verticillium alfalfae (strain VaMs.102 / ATCC MYA-4576 / FGSC 10136) TaxID=526221 RepID=C9SAR1_VERA1|nr:carotenoid cleavage dioxygenase [Verticillium alfalfae VaMs.102]EEY16350.1 carotenoid cleavage dioxygenase [Verticillium alfalfae VaMs.102]